MDGLSTHAKGLLFTGLGVLVITPDSLLIRLVSADQWTLLFWRGLFSAIGMQIALLVLFRRRAWREVRRIGTAGMVLAGIFGIGTVTFVVSISHTTAANTLFIVSTSPLFAAIAAWVLMREPVSLRTWAAIGFSLAGIGVIASGGLDRGTLIGNLAALATAVILGASFALVRLHRARNMVPAMGLSGLVTALVALPLAQPEILDAFDLGVLMIMGLIMLPLSFGLMFIGPRYIPAPEVSLVLLLEAVLGPLWVWLALGEDPGVRTLLGGAIVLATLVVHSTISLWRTSPIRPGP